MPIQPSFANLNLIFHVDVFVGVDRLDRQTVEQLKEYPPRVMCLIQDMDDGAHWLLTSSPKAPQVWAPPQKTIKEGESVAEAAERCLKEELGITSSYHVEQSAYVAHRNFPEARQSQHVMPDASLRATASHTIKGRAYWLAHVILDRGVKIRPNRAQVDQAEWMDFGELNRRLRSNPPDKLQILQKAWRQLGPASCGQLRAWLKDWGVDLTGWGRDEAKSLENLWREIESGDCFLCRRPARRLVCVTFLEIQRNIDGARQVLVEDWQRLDRLQQRRRGGLPAEKMRFGESPLEAAARCLAEELGLGITSEQLDQWHSAGHVQVAQPQMDGGQSRSYPGLESQYWFYRVTINADAIDALGSLPTEQFFQTMERDDAVVEHDWRWIAPGDIPPFEIKPPA